MRTRPVRIQARTHRLLKQLAEHQRRPIAELVQEAVERYRRGQLFEAAHAAYHGAASKKDSSLAAWENALADGLADE